MTECPPTRSVHSGKKLALRSPCFLLIQLELYDMKYINYLPVTWAISGLQFRSRERKKKESGAGPIGEETVVKAVELESWPTVAVPSESKGFISLSVD